MSKKVVQYTCVFTCLVWIGPCLGDSKSSGSDSSGVDITSASKPVRADANDVPERNSILEKARETNDELYRNLRSFVCNEQIERYKGALYAETGRQIDTVTATVSFENGTEHYSDIHQNSRTRPSMSSVAGAWSEGEFGTLLRQTQVLLSEQTPFFDSYADVNGVRAAVYEMEVSREESPWDLEVKSQHYRLPFRTTIWVSEANGQILKIERVSTSMPLSSGISEIRWNVLLKEVDLNGKVWLLPNLGEYAVLYEDSGHREWNVMHFSNYHRYGSEVAIKFQ